MKSTTYICYFYLDQSDHLLCYISLPTGEKQCINYPTSRETYDKRAKLVIFKAFLQYKTQPLNMYRRYAKGFNTYVTNM